MKKEQFRTKLEPIHKTFWKQAYKRLSAKMSALKSALKRRSEKAGVKCPITKEQIRRMFYDAYGKGCKYCDKRLDYRSIACDHIVPLIKKRTEYKAKLAVNMQDLQYS